MRNLISFAVGGLFGLGLLISGMTDTTKVIGWLDVFGAWDPTLAFVLGGAILPMAVAWQIGARRGNRAFNGMMLPSPSNAGVDRYLVVGSTLFGMGWGLAGLCPGPALASAMFGGVGGLAFLLAMAL
ncbi:MAG: putative membrane protein YedE/YeeE, partial [Polaromonas sp.]